MAKRDYHDEEINLKEIINENNNKSKSKNLNNNYSNGNLNNPNKVTGKADISKLIPKELKIVAKNESQKKLIQSIRNNEITICAGAPGSGKTFIALSQALALLRKENSPYKKIYLVKSITSLDGEDLGHLKGTVAEKLYYSMFSFFINVEKIIGEFALKILIEKEVIKPFPLAFISGVTLDDCLIIADECQNITMQNSRRIMTRIGSNAKILILGDVNQIDIKNKHDSSLAYLLEMFENTPSVGVVQMDDNDENVRNPIIASIEKEFKKYYNKDTNTYNKEIKH